MDENSIKKQNSDVSKSLEDWLNTTTASPIPLKRNPQPENPSATHPKAMDHRSSMNTSSRSPSTTPRENSRKSARVSMNPSSNAVVSIPEMEPTGSRSQSKITTSLSKEYTSNTSLTTDPSGGTSPLDDQWSFLAKPMISSMSTRASVSERVAKHRSIQPTPIPSPGSVRTSRPRQQKTKSMLVTRMDNESTRSDAGKDPNELDPIQALMMLSKSLDVSNPTSALADDQGQEEEDTTLQGHPGKVWNRSSSTAAQPIISEHDHDPLVMQERISDQEMKSTSMFTEDNRYSANNKIQPSRNSDQYLTTDASLTDMPSHSIPKPNDKRVSNMLKKPMHPSPLHASTSTDNVSIIPDSPQSIQSQKPKRYSDMHIVSKYNKGKRVVRVDSSQEDLVFPLNLHHARAMDARDKRQSAPPQFLKSNESLEQHVLHVNLPEGSRVNHEESHEAAFTNQNSRKSSAKSLPFVTADKSEPVNKRISMMPRKPAPVSTRYVGGSLDNVDRYDCSSLTDLDQYWFYSNPNSRAASTTSIVLMEEDMLNPPADPPEASKDMNEDGMPKTAYEKFMARKPGALPSGRSKLLKLPDSSKLKDRIQKRARPWFIIIISTLQVACFIAELGLNHRWSGQVIATSPFNYLIGPATGVLLQMGARYAPCMRSEPQFPDVQTPSIVCPPAIYVPPSAIERSKLLNQTVCTLPEVCGMGGFPDNNPNQWWRFFTAMFLHNGLLHIGLNFSFQIRTGIQLEQEMGTLRLAIIYFVSGVGGFVFSGIFSGMTVSVGCSGALYGLIACLLLDLLHNWKFVRKPVIQLLKLVVQIAFALILGTIPGIDNFAHVGGFFTGFIMGMILMQSLQYGKWTRRLKIAIIAAGIPLLITVFVLLFKGFYGSGRGDTCPWCKYFNCLPFWPWCEEKWAGTR